MGQVSLKDVLEKHRTGIMQIPGIIGVGVGLSPTCTNKQCILVYTTAHEWPPLLPRQIDGYDVEIVKKKKGFHTF